MLDTFIGKNDGVPFTVPGKSGFVAEKAAYEKAQIPDYLEAVENPNDPSKPGTIARLGLKNLSWGDVELLDPERVVICGFPGPNAKWEWEPEDIKGDSCVAVYWPQVPLQPGETMHVAASYGLGKLDVSDQLALSVPPSVQPGREFVVTAYVYNAIKGQKITLDLPPGLEPAGSSPFEQVVPEDARRTQLFWKVRADREGKFQIGVTSEKSRAKPVTVAVQARSIFG